MKKLHELAAGVFHIGQQNYPDKQGVVAKFFTFDSEIDLHYHTTDMLGVGGFLDVRDDLLAAVESCKNKEFILVEFDFDQSNTMVATITKIAPVQPLHTLYRRHRRRIEALNVFYYMERR